MRKTLTNRGVVALKPRRRRYAHSDPELRGHYVRVQPSGSKAFVVAARDPLHKQIWVTLGNADTMTIDEAREKARVAIRRIKDGKPAFEPPPVQPDLFKSIAENWIKRHVEKNKLRTRREIERVLNVYVYPHWADRPSTGIRRSDVSALLDTSRTTTVLRRPIKCSKSYAALAIGMPPEMTIMSPPSRAAWDEATTAPGLEFSTPTNCGRSEGS